MVLQLLKTHYGVRPNGMVHIGANSGQEVPVYRDSGVKPIVLVEPLEHPFRQLVKVIDGADGLHAVQACLSDTAGREVTFHVASNGGQSSSYLEPAAHLSLAPKVKFNSVEVMTTDTLDRVLERLCREQGVSQEIFDLIVIDTQGAEFDILRGAPHSILNAKYIYMEVNFGGMYQNDTGIYDGIEIMRSQGFDLYWMSVKSKGWGDALFMRREVIDPRRIAAPRRPHLDHDRIALEPQLRARLAEAAELTQLLAKAREENARLKAASAEISRLRRQARKLEKEIVVMRKSKSWRWTEPMRKLLESMGGRSDPAP